MSATSQKNNKKAINYKTVLMGFILQISFAIFIFKVPLGQKIFLLIGEFIRKTSIDELPQFFNVLKGDMSLVGTRPPTRDEWEKYDLHHRARLATKPGITGMWQVSGRSNITDFEEIVKLDMKYINEWNMGLDIKLLIKTVMQVLKRDGSL